MFNHTLIHTLRRDVSRLRRDLRYKDRVIDTLMERARLDTEDHNFTVKELLDRFVHKRVPERLVNTTSQANGMVTAPGPNDLYTSVMEEAERLADEQANLLKGESNDTEV